MANLRDALCSIDLKELAQAYIALAGYYGWHEFDSYPLSLTQHEVHERYNMLAECPCTSCDPPEIAEDDNDEDD